MTAAMVIEEREEGLLWLLVSKHDSQMLDIKVFSPVYMCTCTIKTYQYYAFKFKRETRQALMRVKL